MQGFQVEGTVLAPRHHDRSDGKPPEVGSILLVLVPVGPEFDAPAPEIVPVSSTLKTDIEAPRLHDGYPAQCWFCC